MTAKSQVKFAKFHCFTITSKQLTWKRRFGMVFEIKTTQSSAKLSDLDLFIYKISFNKICFSNEPMASKRYFGVEVDRTRKAVLLKPNHVYLFKVKLLAFTLFVLYKCQVVRR